MFSFNNLIVSIYYFTNISKENFMIVKNTNFEKVKEELINI
jgi:hypothetical protein